MSFDQWFNDSAKRAAAVMSAKERPTEIECEICEGTGRTFEMVCYGGPPVERDCDCPDCDGLGIIKVALSTD